MQNALVFSLKDFDTDTVNVNVFICDLTICIPNKFLQVEIPKERLGN